VDAASALADLTEISPHVEAAVVVDRDGAVVASRPDGADAGKLAQAGAELMRRADERLARGGRTPTRLEAALRDGSVFVARAEGRSIVARTGARPPSALVLSDLQSCLDALAPKPRRRRKATAGA
jgi:predicted regulator of Ras-like GTPase activity (Roadblock/LC7/MglB family)